MSLIVSPLLCGTDGLGPALHAMSQARRWLLVAAVHDAVVAPLVPPYATTTSFPTAEWQHRIPSISPWFGEGYS